jgi:uncharacterized protein YybS (DUF2232 family)
VLKAKFQIGLWLFILVALSTSFVTPLALLGYMFIIVPMVVLMLLQTPRNLFSLGIITSLTVPAILSYSTVWFVWAYVLLMILPAVWMANAYKRGDHAKTVLRVGTIGVTVSFILLYAILTIAYPHMLEGLAALIRESMQALPQQLSDQLGDGFVDRYIDMVTKTIPMTMLVIAFMIAAITHTTTRRMMRRYGIQLSELKVADEWRVPRSWIIIYGIAVLMNLGTSSDDKGFMSIALMNLIPVLMVAFSIQAVGFLVYLARYKKWAKAMPALCIVLYPAISALVVLLGILDIAFPLRKSLNNNEG